MGALLLVHSFFEFGSFNSSVDVTSRVAIQKGSTISRCQGARGLHLYEGACAVAYLLGTESNSLQIREKMTVWSTRKRPSQLRSMQGNMMKITSS